MSASVRRNEQSAWSSFWLSAFDPALLLRRPLTQSAVLMTAFRVLVASCQAVTFWITWPLWQVHASPPMLPAVPLPTLDLGWLLVASLVLVVLIPVPGLVVHTGLLVYAILIDQTRIQPEFISLAFLMWGTLPSHTAKTFARAHLISLWIFAGVNKLFSPGFMDGTAQWILTGLVNDPSPWLYEHAGYVIAFSELSVGVLALLPWTRKIAAIAALALHAGIFVDLSPMGHDWNEAVWPWNIALAFAGFAIIAPWKGSAIRCIGLCPRVLRPVVVLLVVSPIGFYVGLTDAYLSHNLYSSNTASSSVRCAEGCLPNQQPTTWAAFNVPFPPEHRLFEQYFSLTCRPGDQLIIQDTRWWFERHDRDNRKLDCDGTT